MTRFLRRLRTLAALSALSSSVGGTLPVAAQAQTGTVTGRITNDRGHPVVDAIVAVGEGVSPTRTDAEGYYVLEVPPGRTEVFVTESGHAPRRGAVTVEAGEAATLDLVLSLVQVLQEIVVSAQRRDQFIQDVGISITALDGDELHELGVATTPDLLHQVPGVYLQEPLGAPGETVNIAIRGVGLNDFNDGTEAPSVLYVDDVYVLPISAGSMPFYDAERIEVLRGPQGTLFGRNVTGGLVHYLTRDPSDRVEGYIRGDAGEHGLVRLEGAANVPVSDAAALRFSGLLNEHGAWARNLGAASDGHEADLYSSARGQLRAELTEALVSVTKVTYGQAQGNVSLTQGDRGADVDARGFVNDGGPGPFVGQAVVDDFTIGQTDSPEFVDNDHLLAVQSFAWELGPTTLTAISGFLDVNRLRVQDCDGTPLDTCRTRFEYGTREFTQELRVFGTDGRTSWTLGAYYLHQNAESTSDAALDTDGTFGEGVPGFGFGGPFVFDVDWDSRVRGWAGFGQVELAVSDRVTLTAGLRYSRDSKTFEMLKRDFVGAAGSEGRLNADYANMFPGVLVNGIGSNLNFTRDGPALDVDTNFDLQPDTALGPAGTLTDRDDDLVNAKLGVDWRPSADLLVFGSWSRGTKSGGFNNGFVTVASNEDIPFEPETLNAFEVGLKASLGQFVRLSAAAFHYRYADYQAVAFQGLGTRTLNKDASLSGGELEVSAYPVTGLEARGSLSLLTTRVEDVGNGVTTFDAEMGLAPDVSLRGMVRYSWPAGPGTLATQGDAYWVDGQFQDVLNHPGLGIPSHGSANVRASYAQGPWELAAWIRNLTDEQIPNARFTLGFGTIMSWYRAPRWFGASLSYRW